MPWIFGIHVFIHSANSAKRLLFAVLTATEYNGDKNRQVPLHHSHT